MKSDMAGGGAVIAAMGAIAEIGLGAVSAVIAACENMPAGDAVRPGDIVRGLNGTTVEITNTDAEGCLILADALVYARNLGATHPIDLATLGGIVVAMGDVYAAFANDDDLRSGSDRREASGDRSGRGRCTRATTGTSSPPSPTSRTRLSCARAPGVRGSVPAAVRGGRRLGARGHGRNGLLERGRETTTTLGATGFGVRLATEAQRGLAE